MVPLEPLAIDADGMQRSPSGDITPVSPPSSTVARESFRRVPRATLDHQQAPAMPLSAPETPVPYTARESFRRSPRSSREVSPLARAPTSPLRSGRSLENAARPLEAQSPKENTPSR
eukprot:5877799-Prymnesium_polylepis.1